MTRQVELNNLNECNVFEVCIQNEKRYIVSLYRSLSQTQYESDVFLLNFEQDLCNIVVKNPLFVLVTSDFNVRAGN